MRRVLAVNGAWKAGAEHSSQPTGGSRWEAVHRAAKEEGRSRHGHWLEARTYGDVPVSPSARKRGIAADLTGRSRSD